MKTRKLTSTFTRRAAAALLALGAIATGAMATEPCGDLGACKALIEINSTDGDIGFHFLMDGDDLNSARIFDPEGTKVFEDMAKGPLHEQKLTETFAESAEPLCWPDPDADEDEEIVTLEEFLERWAEGDYLFTGMGDGGEKSEGWTRFSYDLPAAPANLDFDGAVISWDAGIDLGNCASDQSDPTLEELVEDGVIPDPADVPVAFWEAVMEPDVDELLGQAKVTIRLPGPDLADCGEPEDGDGVASGASSDFEVAVPQEYLDSLPPDTPVKIEVGAIGCDDNATFTEADGFCVNYEEGCAEEDE